MGDVAQPQLDGVDLQPDGQLVDRRLEGEIGLRRAGRAVRVGGRLVGRHLEAADVEAWNAIGPAQEVCGQPRVPARRRAVVVVVPGAEGDQRPILSRAQLERELGRRSRMPDHELVGSHQRQSNRPAQSKGEQRQQRLEELDLAAEAAADRHRDNAHLVRRQIDKRGHAVADDERSLRGGPDGEPAVGLGTHDRDMRLFERDPVHRHHVNCNAPPLVYRFALWRRAALLALLRLP